MKFYVVTQEIYPGCRYSIDESFSLTIEDVRQWLDSFAWENDTFEIREIELSEQEVLRMIISNNDVVKKLIIDYINKHNYK